jgi:drug/metabolite transporter (DMT)-like permease
MLAGYLLFGFAPMLARAAMQRGWDGPHALLLRFFVAGLLTLACAQFARRWGSKGLKNEFTLKAQNPRGLFLRGLYGGLAASCYFSSMYLVGAGLGTLLNYTYAVFANLILVAFYGHRPPRRFWALLAMAALGLYLVVSPQADRQSPTFTWGVALGLGSGIMAALSIIAIKDLRKTDNALSINAAYSLGAFLLAIPTAAFTQSRGYQLPWSDLTAWGALLVSAVLSFGGQMLFNHGFKQTPVSQASLLALLAPVVAIFGGWALLGEKLTPHFFAGAALILAACALTRPDAKRPA